MLRLPRFHYHRPADLEEAVRLKAEHQERAAYLAGGTDVLVKMKRRQEEPGHLIQLGQLTPLHRIETEAGGSLRLGAGITLSALAEDRRVRAGWPVLAAAARQVGTPAVRNMATLGGNLCLDTRCSFYDQSLQWRRAIDFCLKKTGDTCRVAGSSKRCWAIQSSDSSAVMIALGAKFELVGPSSTRSVDASAFYNDDGIHYLNKDPAELLSAVSVPALEDARSAYLRVSRRRSFDYPLLTVAVWIRQERSAAGDAPVQEARVVLGALGSSPILVTEAADILRGRPLSEESIEEAARAAARRARPMDNADLSGSWRKRVLRTYVQRALRRLGSEDQRSAP